MGLEAKDMDYQKDNVFQFVWVYKIYQIWFWRTRQPEST